MIRSPCRFLLGGGAAATALLLLSNLSSVTLAQPDPPKMCMMMYMMADSNLEPQMFKDVAEYFGSDAMYQPNVDTWIYWDR